MMFKNDGHLPKRSEIMTSETHINSDRKDVRATFKEIREKVEKAQSREELTELYKQSVYMILMTHSSPVDEKFDRDLKRRREATEREFARAVRTINRRAKKIGVEADYSDDWERIATNGYETEGESLEAQTDAEVISE
jgi:hypothetical protein